MAADGGQAFVEADVGVVGFGKGGEVAAGERGDELGANFGVGAGGALVKAGWVPGAGCLQLAPAGGGGNGASTPPPLPGLLKDSRRFQRNPA